MPAGAGAGEHDRQRAYAQECFDSHGPQGFCESYGCQNVLRLIAEYDALQKHADTLASAAETLDAHAQLTLKAVMHGRPDLGLPETEERWYSVSGRDLDALNAAVAAYRATAAPAQPAPG